MTAKCKTCNDLGEITPPGFQPGITHIGFEKPIPCPDCNSGEPTRAEARKLTDPERDYRDRIERSHRETIQALSDIFDPRYSGDMIPARKRRLRAMWASLGVSDEHLREWDCENLISWGQ